MSSARMRLWKAMSCPSVTSRCPWPSRVTRHKAKGELYEHVTKATPLYAVHFTLSHYCLVVAAVRVACFEA